MKLPSLTEIVLSGALVLGFSSVADSAKIKHTSWSTEEMGYMGTDYWVHNYKIIVQPDDNLTKIAQQIEKLRGKYSECLAPSKISWQDVYNKNKKRIKNPDLIYPGQEFKFNYTERNPQGHLVTF